MSDHHFHVHGVEDHQVEHQAHHGVGLAQWVAVLSAIFSCLAAFISYQSASKQNEAILLKNDAIIKTTEASNMWSYLQAKKNKKHLMEVAIAATSDQKKIARFQKEMLRYQGDETPIQKQAESLTQQAKTANEESDKLIKPHEKLAEAMMLLQIAISLASITALTRKKWLLGFSLGAAIIGISFAILGWMA